jgi:hypothetical protein
MTYGSVINRNETEINTEIQTSRNITNFTRQIMNELGLYVPPQPATEAPRTRNPHRATYIFELMADKIKKDFKKFLFIMTMIFYPSRLEY